MPIENSHGPSQAMLYAPVSSDEEARSGCSLAQKHEALRESYEVLEKAPDPRHSRSRPQAAEHGPVRDLVATGGVSVMLAKECDRFAREPEYLFVFWGEFVEHENKVLNERRDGNR